MINAIWYASRGIARHSTGASRWKKSDAEFVTAHLDLEDWKPELGYMVSLKLPLGEIDFGLRGFA